MNNGLMILQPAQFQVTFGKEAEAMREAALAESGIIGRVSNPEEQAVAVAAQRKLRELVTAVEKARKDAKAPVLDYGRAIDRAAESFVEEVKAEEMRVATLVGNFQEEELKRRRAAEAAARLEAERLERERQAEIRKKQEAERIEKERIEAEQRRLREESAKADAARKAELDKIAAELERQKQIAAAASAAEMNKIDERYNQANAAVAVHEPVRAQGQIVREEWEVTVNDLWTLARVHPACVEITPKLREIKDLLNLGVDVKGVSARKVVKATVSGRGAKAITVEPSTMRIA